MCRKTLLNLECLSIQVHKGGQWHEVQYLQLFHHVQCVNMCVFLTFSFEHIVLVFEKKFLKFVEQCLTKIKLELTLVRIGKQNILIKNTNSRIRNYHLFLPSDISD
jgi:hypothetical protein